LTVLPEPLARIPPGYFPGTSLQGNLHHPRSCSGALLFLDRQNIIQGIYQRLGCKTDFETNFETIPAVFCYLLKRDSLKTMY
jgi:hypothetical protein